MINAGPTATFGLLALGSAWLATTGLGVLQAWRGNVVAHRRWMTRSLALTMVTTSLRFWFVLSLPFAAAYPAVACLGWIPACVLAESWLHGKKETVADLLRDRRFSPGPRTHCLGVEIIIERPDC
jgi:hypothetical protein